jgi:DNA polymerase-4
MNSNPIRKIIHVDMDAFYASVEQRDDPSLKGQPVAVGYGAKRGVVAAASYEARTFGVRSALPSVTALRRCPHLVFVPPRFEVYRAVSRQVHGVFAEFTDLIEPLALDEAYLDVTDNRAGLPTAWATAKVIRARILEETGLTASAGISYNKFLAKMASGQRKPNGQFAITPDQGETFMEALPIAKFHGVGPKTAEKMHAAGIKTGADLKLWSLEDLSRRFGSHGPWYFGLARGLDDRRVNPNRERKSSGSETTFGEDLIDAERIEVGVLSQADEGLVREVRSAGAHRHRKNQMGRFPAINSQPVLRFSDRQPSQIARGEPRADPIGSTRAERRAPRGRHSFELRQWKRSSTDSRISPDRFRPDLIRSEKHAAPARRVTHLGNLCPPATIVTWRS